MCFDVPERVTVFDVDTPEAQAWVGRGIRYRRTKVGLSQMQLAAVLRDELGMDIDQADIANLEAGSRAVGLVEAMGFAAALGTTVDVLLFGTLGEIEDRSDPDILEVVPDYISLGTRRIGANALGETLGEGLADMAEYWRPPASRDADIVDPVTLVERVQAILADPEGAALVDSEDLTSEQVSQHLPATAKALTSARAPRGGWTVTSLFDTLVGERISDVGEPENERGLRTMQAAIRRKIRNDLIRRATHGK